MFLEDGCSVEVCVSPALYPIYENKEAIVVVTDVFRATSAICAAFEYGVSGLIPVKTIEEAIEYQQKGYLVGAERNGEVVEGFDFGNSPYSYMDEKLKGKTVVLTTTNGTKAVQIAKDAHALVIGSFINITALANWLKVQGKDVLILCSGWKDRYNMEDTLFAGALVDQLSEKPQFSLLGDGALSAKYLYQTAKEDPFKFLHNSSHRRRLAKLNLKEDIRYCLTPDQSSKIPVLKDGKLVELSVTEKELALK